MLKKKNKKFGESEFFVSSLVEMRERKKKIPAELFDEGGGVAGDVAREVDGVNALEDDVVRLHGIQAGEGGRSRQQLEHENAQRPVVGANVVPFVQNHFGGHVFGSAAKRPRFPAGLSTSQLKVTDRVQVPKPKKSQKKKSQNVKNKKSWWRTCNFLAKPKSTSLT